MGIATTTQYWTSRYNGTDPTVAAPTDNEAYTATGSGGSASAGNWVITDQYLTRLPTSTDLTILACFYYTAVPDADTVLLSLDNGTHKAEVQANGLKFNLVGATTATTIEIDTTAADDSPIILRLTLNASGVAKLYVREIIYDWEGADHFISVTGTNNASGQSHIKWGNDSGTVNWATVYGTHHGAFSPEELSPSAWTTDILLRMGLSVRDTLRASQRMYLKTQVHDSSIVYGFDISGKMVSRLSPPTIHVLLQNVGVPSLMSLGGGKADMEFRVQLFITTVGSDYKEAYKLGMEIAGECFDELFTSTGLNGTTDALEGFESTFDTRMDDDEIVCIHNLNFRYRRRVNMRTR